ncbi:UDP-N-acetylmuramate dehydrogenase [Formosa sp. S-31]|uniref:UDP-N-acetylmuramate dehydrogenase n=1 Tax=Formosa sp. S-31 TaxID=2790949 RepID=UPI003EBD8070
MQIQHNIALKPYNTFGIDAVAKHFVAVSTLEDLVAVLHLEQYPEIFILGGGSNILLTKDLDTLVVLNQIKGIEIVSESDNEVIVKANAGENWHNFVLWCLDQDFGGLENLSLIPGNVGTSPIQNIGAYGVELKDVFYSCEALNLQTKKIETFNNADCKFGYRNSIFKHEAKGKYIITSVSFRLSKTNHTLHTNYGAITSELESLGVSNPTIQDVSKAVINIRNSKLPNPKDMGNSGSFFKNPVISTQEYNALLAQFPEAPCYKVSDNEVKVPAGWLIEKAGFKGKNMGQYGVHKNQALVLVNYGNAKGEDIFKFSQLIQKTILRIFNIHIESEVNIL